MNDYHDYDRSDELREIELSERLRKKEKHRSRMMMGTALFVGALLLLGAFLFLDRMFLKVETVSIVGCEQIEESAVAAIAEPYAGRSMLFVNGKKIERACAALDEAVADVSVKKQFPNTILITVREEQPLFYCGYQISEEKTAYIVVAESLKVLRIFDGREAAEHFSHRLTEVRLPQIAYCALGETLRFADEQNAKILPTVVKTVEESSFKEDLSLIDFTTRFDIRLYGGVRADGGQAPRYEIRLGNRTELEKKLTFAEGILKEMGEEFVGTISVEDPNSGYIDPE